MSRPDNRLAKSISPPPILEEKDTEATTALTHALSAELIVDKLMEQKLAKKYYDKLFKEYCIADLSRYTENKIAMRWRTKQEVVVGKGQFVCGDKKCSEKADLRSWEVNFAYAEGGQRKNALIKLRLCVECSAKLNYGGRKRQAVRKTKRKSVSETSDVPEPEATTSTVDNAPIKDVEGTTAESTSELPSVSSDVWSKPQKIEEEKPREDEFEEFLEDLLL